MLHDLRHAAACWLRMSGADIHTVAEPLGHKDLLIALPAPESFVFLG